MKIDGYELTMTCSCCPEQYDVTDEDDKQVGYLRLRNGSFTVECPDVCDELVYSAEPDGDGAFMEDERDGYLKKAVTAIDSWCKQQSENL